MWNVQNGEWAPLYCMLVVFIQADGKSFIKTIIVNQEKDYSKDLHFNIKL